MTQAMTSDTREFFHCSHEAYLSTPNSFPEFSVLENTCFFPDYGPSLKWLHIIWEQATKQLYVLLWQPFILEKPWRTFTEAAYYSQVYPV